MNHSLWRDGKTQQSYAKYVASKPTDAACEFCQLKATDDQIVQDAGSFWVARNLYPYTIWDSFFVDEHLMLIPKRHIDSIGGLYVDERVQFAELLADYEAVGYSIYGRAANNGAKSIAHQHTHLIKVSSRKLHSLLYSRLLGITRFR